MKQQTNRRSSGIPTLLVIMCLFVVLRADNLYHKIIHNYDPEAKCLDGSPGLLYLHQGGDPTKILIFFQGGGLCGQETYADTLESCYKRSKTLLGSSTLWPESFEGQGYLSTDSSVSSFANWTKIVLGYCDGALHQGNNPSPVSYKDTKLYFRGAAITRSHFDWINTKFPFAQAQKIILTGGSAGGVGTFLWNNYFIDYVKKPDIVHSIPDSGVFLNVKTITGDNKIQKMIKNLFILANPTQKTPFQECNKDHFQEQWKCLFIQNGVTKIRGKFMVINSQYDGWAIANILGVKCLHQGKHDISLQSCNRAQMSLIEKYRENFKKVILQLGVSNVQSSVWAISCCFHVYACLDLMYNSALEKVPQYGGYTVKMAVENFVLKGERVVSYDVENWPNNVLCSGK